MSNPERPQDRSGGAPARDGKGTFAAQVQRLVSKPPPPPGRGLAMLVLSVVVAIAAVYQLSSGSGTGKRMAETLTPSERPTPSEAPRMPAAEAAPSGDVEPSGPSPGASEPPRRVVLEEVTAPAPPPVRAPGADIPVPAGIGPRTASALRLALGALAPGEAAIMAEDAIRHLPDVVRGADEGERALVRAYVLQRLAPLVGRHGLGALALDAALALVEGDEAALGPVVEAARLRGLGDDRTAVAAIVFLDAVPASARGTAPEDLAILARDEGRSLCARVVALEHLARWGALDAALAAWAAEQAAPLAEAARRGR